MKYKAILFDMDGTLLDTLADMVSAVNHILSVHGWPLRTTEEVRTFVGNGARRLMERALPPTVTGEDFETVLTEYRDWYQAHNCVDTAPYAGIPAVLAFLLSGRRASFPRIWHVLYFLLLLAQVVLLCWQPWLWLNGESVSGIGLALVVADIVALIWLLTNRRLRACFNEEKE